MKTSEEINEIAKALSELQGSMGPAKKDQINPYFKSYYADLTSVWNAIRDPLHENGLCVLQDAVTTEIGISVITRIIHSSGQWIEYGPLIVPLAKNDAQAVGSAISYGKRYAIGAALGVVAEVDDDGNKATKAAGQKTVKFLDKSQKSYITEVFNDDPESLKTLLAYLKVSSINSIPDNLWDKVLKSCQNYQQNKNEANDDSTVE